MAFNEVHPVSVDNSVILASDSEVVGDEFDWPFERGCHPGLPWAAELAAVASPATWSFVSRVLVLM